MKLIIVNGGIAECTLNSQLGLLRMLNIVRDLYILIPEASIYIDIGSGAKFINPQNPQSLLNTISPTAFNPSEDNHA